MEERQVEVDLTDQPQSATDAAWPGTESCSLIGWRLRSWNLIMSVNILNSKQDFDEHYFVTLVNHLFVFAAPVTCFVALEKLTHVFHHMAKSYAADPLCWSISVWCQLLTNEGGQITSNRMTSLCLCIKISFKGVLAIYWQEDAVSFWNLLRDLRGTPTKWKTMVLGIVVPTKPK